MRRGSTRRLAASVGTTTRPSRNPCLASSRPGITECRTNLQKRGNEAATWPSSRTEKGSKRNRFDPFSRGLPPHQVALFLHDLARGFGMQRTLDGDAAVLADLQGD